MGRADAVATARGPRRPELLDAAVAAVTARLAEGDGRCLVGITGPPAAGKSTLAAALAAAFTADGDPGAAVAVPMDGFHLSNVELARLGLSDRKGAPATFDVGGFVHLLRRIRAGDELVYAPSFNRALNESIGSDIPVFPHTRVVVVEGNYLLLADGAWAQVRPLLDLAIYLDAPDGTRLPALLRRQQARGLDIDGARDWVERSDEANARLIATTRPFADVVLTRGASAAGRAGSQPPAR
jgi:pantothenate kinase